MQTAALAAHRLGWGEPRLSKLSSDPQGWVLAQWKTPTPFDGRGLASGQEAFEVTRDVLRNAAQSQAQAPNKNAGQGAGSVGQAPDKRRQRLRAINRDGLLRRWQHVVGTSSPVVERWVQFWSNHFSVSATKASVAGLVWAFENEAIRPHAMGRFVDLLRAVVTHPGMLLYLDNAQSIGPDSVAGRRRQKGLNENLARELLELHTLGVKGGYTQNDVTEAARVLTGWSVRPESGGAGAFVARLHQPGRKVVLGRTYAEGPEALDQLLINLSRHPSCARWLSHKLAMHFVTDQPPAALVDALAQRFLATDGDLSEVAHTLWTHPITWQGGHPPKFKRPEECVLSAHRVLQMPLSDGRAFDVLFQDVQAMGQPMGRAPSPQGWPDSTSHWLAPDALLKRVDWSVKFAQQHGAKTDARDLAQAAMGADLKPNTRQQLERAESGTQALALWLASPDFQWR